MRSNILRTSVLLLAVAMSVAISGCASSKLPDEPANIVGGNYMVFTFGGLSARDGRPAVAGGRLTITDFGDLKEIRADCVPQVEAQAPSVVRDVGTSTLQTAVPTTIGGAAGTGYGASAALGASATDYAKYAGASVGGSSLGSGIAGGASRYKTAMDLSEYACIQANVAKAAKAGRLRTVSVGPNYFTTRPRGVAKPTGPATPPPPPAPSGASEDNAQPVVVP